jgi:hypothetical protein
MNAAGRTALDVLAAIGAVWATLTLAFIALLLWDELTYRRRRRRDFGE